MKKYILVLGLGLGLGFPVQQSEGATAIEYGLIANLIGLGIIVDIGEIDINLCLADADAACELAVEVPASHAYPRRVARRVPV